MLQLPRNSMRLSPLGLLVLAACKSDDLAITPNLGSVSPNSVKLNGTVTKRLL